MVSTCLFHTQFLQLLYLFFGECIKWGQNNWYHSHFYYYSSRDFFIPALPDGLSLESDWQRVTSSLLESSNYSGWSQKCCSLDDLDSPSDFQFFKHPFENFGIVPCMSITFGITVILICHLFLSSLARSSSSYRAGSTDIPDPLSPLLPIVHRPRQVFRTSKIEVFISLSFIFTQWFARIASSLLFIYYFFFFFCNHFEVFKLGSSDTYFSQNPNGFNLQIIIIILSKWLKFY